MRTYSFLTFHDDFTEEELFPNKQLYGETDYIEITANTLETIHAVYNKIYKGQGYTIRYTKEDHNTDKVVALLEHPGRLEGERVTLRKAKEGETL